MIGDFEPPRVLPVVVVCVLAACGPAGDSEDLPDPVTRTDSAGVTIVLNEGADVPLEWRVEEVLSIGGADEGPSSFFDVPEHSIEAATTGDVLVLDAGNGRVLRFDSLGTPLGAVATRGDGPEELRRPQSMALDARDRVTVLDMPRLGVLTFTAEGDFVGRVELGVPYGEIAYFRGGLLHPGESTFRSRRDTLRPSLVWRTADGTVELARVARPRPSMYDFGCIGLALEPLFSPDLAWGTNGRRVAVAAGEAYDVRIFDGDDEPTARYRRSMAPRVVTQEIAVAELGEGTVVRSPAGACQIDPHVEIEARGFHPVLPVVDDVAVDPEGRLWIRRSAFRGEVSRIDIFAADGRYLGTLAGLDVFPSAFLGPELFLARTVDELDVEYVKVFRVQEK